MVSGLAAFVAVALISAAPASAGYLSLGIGQGADLHGEMDTRFQREDDSNSGRLAVGQRTGPLAIEAALSGSDIGETRSVSLSIDLKLYKSLVGPLDLYGRGGIGKTWLEHPFAGDDDYAGRNKQLGVGLELGFNAPVGQLGLFVDLSRQWLDLSANGQGELEGELDMLQVGVAVGL